MFAKSYLILCFQWLAAGVISVGLIWAITDRADVQTAEVTFYAFVPETPATISIDESIYVISDPEGQPIVLDLRPGRHELKLWRDGVAVHQEWFEVPAVTSYAMGAWIREPPAVAPMSGSEANAPTEWHQRPIAR